METAIAAPLTGDEIIEAIVGDLRKRLQSNCKFQLGKEYAGFEIEYSHTIILHGLGSNGGGMKDTLAWGKIEGGEKSDAPEVLTETGAYRSDLNDVNAVREEHNLPLTIETGDGKGGKVTKKVKQKKS